VTGSELALRAKIGGHARWSKVTDRYAALSGARRGFLAKFERQVDPEGKLDPATRAQMAEQARRAYMAKLALRSAITRRRNAEKKTRPGRTAAGSSLDQSHGERTAVA
jgi:hypothetical protein